MHKNKWFTRIGVGLFLVVLLLGWRYPYLAYCMFINVAFGLWSAFKTGGRAGCGAWCPRGMFYGQLPDTGRKLPSILRSKPFNLIAMLIFFALVILIRPLNLRSWGVVFYWMIAATTLIGVAGYFIFNRFFWCSICPMGRIYRKIHGRQEKLIRVSSACIGCRKCEKVCPFNLPISEAKAGGTLLEKDCIKCERCVNACPKHAIDLK